jgi:prepilin-type N-terminal cleavage/methylation domain-containing protein
MQTSTSSRRAFSLLELMIVMTMVALVAMMAFGRNSSMLNGWRVSRAAQAYGEELQMAFALVGRNRKPLLITMDSIKMELRLTDRTGNIIYRRRNFGSTSAYKLDWADFRVAPTTLQVFPPGLAEDSLSVKIDRLGKYRRIRMLRGGLVQICSNKEALNAICVPA